MQQLKSHNPCWGTGPPRRPSTTTLQRRSVTPVSQTCPRHSKGQNRDLNLAAFCLRLRISSVQAHRNLGRWAWQTSFHPLYKYENEGPRTSLAIQWLGLPASNERGMGLIPGQGTKLSHPTCLMVWPKKKKNEGSEMAGFSQADTVVQLRQKIAPQSERTRWADGPHPLSTYMLLVTGSSPHDTQPFPRLTGSSYKLWKFSGLRSLRKSVIAPKPTS